MTPTDTAALLAIVAANDRRTTGDTDLEIWHDALSDLEFEDCRAAVREHIRDGDGWLMPAHVRRVALGLARKRAGELRQAELGGPPGACGVPGHPCQPPTRAEALEQGRRGAEVLAAIEPAFRRVP